MTTFRVVVVAGVDVEFGFDVKVNGKDDGLIGC